MQCTLAVSSPPEKLKDEGLEELNFLLCFALAGQPFELIRK